MSRKDYTLLADCLGASIEGTGPDHLDLGREARVAVITTATVVADELARAYPNFDRVKFLARVDPDIPWPPPVTDGAG